MSLTLPELKARLAAKFDEVSLLEILNVNAEELVEVFEDKILEREEQLLELFNEDDEFQQEEHREENVEN